MHISSNVESRVSVSVNSKGLIVKIQVSCYLEGSVRIDNHHVLIGTESQTHNEGVNIYWIVVSTASCSITVTQSHKSVDLTLLRRFSPCGDAQESSNQVPVDGEEEVLIRRVHTSLVESGSLSEVEPILSLKEVVHKWPNIKESRSCGIDGGWQRGWVVELLVVSQSEGEAKSQKEHSIELAHILFQLASCPPLNIYRALATISFKQLYTQSYKVLSANFTSKQTLRAIGICTNNSVSCIYF